MESKCKSTHCWKTRAPLLTIWFSALVPCVHPVLRYEHSLAGVPANWLHKVPIDICFRKWPVATVWTKHPVRHCLPKLGDLRTRHSAFFLHLSPPVYFYLLWNVARLGALSLYVIIDSCFCIPSTFTADADMPGFSPFLRT